ncbi:MAG: hypothetical protein MR821_01425, partial [Clostridiales bacterium]|nr:hypothetical protein [Clostridiales bacterium]
ALKLLFLLNNKGTLGCRPNLLEGFHPSNSLLRFALIFELLSASQYNNREAMMGFGGSESVPPVESESAAACGGIRQAKDGNRKERLWRDYAGFPDRQPNVSH